MKRYIYIILSLLLVITGCDKMVRDEIAQLHQDIDAVKTRLDALTNEMNTNISSLKTIVEALQSNDFVQKVVPFKENGKEVGYEITFSKMGKIIIYHGKDGVDGQDGTDGVVPQFGIRQAEDGNWYWTMDGKWVLDDAGQRVRAVGKDGSNGVDGENGQDGQDGADGAAGYDGVTPQFKIENGYWFVSYDKALTWSRLGKATGADGAPGKDANSAEAIFNDVKIQDNDVVFTLKDGTVITINKNRALKITFESTTGIQCAPGKTVRIPYTITGGDSKTFVECMADQGWKARVEATDTQSGHVCVTAPNPMVDGKVLVFVNAGDGRTYVTKLTIVEGRPMVENSVFYIGYKGGSVEISVTTREDYDVKIVGTPAWIALEPGTKAAERVDKLTFTVQKNPYSVDREAEVQLYSEYGDLLESFKIMQYQNNSSEGAIIFADPDVEALCVANFDTDGDGYVSFAEAAAVETLGSIFTSKSTIDTFEELKYFTKLTTLGNGFNSCTNLKKVILPENLTVIAANAFYSCKNLYSVVLPNKLETIGKYAFLDCTALANLSLPASLKGIGDYAFERCKTLTEMILPEGLVSIGGSAFRECTALSKVVLPTTLDAMGTHMFYDCLALESISIPEKITAIPRYMFNGCKNLSEVNLSSNITSIDYYAFGGCASLTNIELPQRLLTIGGCAFYNCSSLSSINLPDLVNLIASSAFQNCVSLKSVVLPKLIKEVASSLFDGCNALESVTIPQNVTYIYQGAFNGCSSLNEVICLPITPPSLGGDSTFSSAKATMKIKVPAGSVDAYKAKQYWSNYATKIVAIAAE